MAFGISKNRSVFAVWQRFQVGKKRQFSKHGSTGDINCQALVARLAQIQAMLPLAGSKGRGKKNLAPNDLVAPRYGRGRETDFGKKVHFFNCGSYRIWRRANTALRYIAAPRPNRSYIVALPFVLCGFVCAVVWSWNGSYLVRVFGACWQQRKLAASFRHHGSPSEC